MAIYVPYDFVVGQRVIYHPSTKREVGAVVRWVGEGARVGIIVDGTGDYILALAVKLEHDPPEKNQ